MGQCLCAEVPPQPVESPVVTKERPSSTSITNFSNSGGPDTHPTVASSVQLSNRAYSYTLSVFSQSCSGTSAPNVYKDNQDDYLCEVSILGNENFSAFGVFDGHGSYGTESSRYVKKSIINQLFNDPTFTKNPSKALKSTFTKVHRELSGSDLDVSCSGTTAVVCVLLETQLTVACAGDSRCVLGYLVSPEKIGHLDLSIDHKPDLPEEKKRIESLGGRVESIQGNDDEPIGPARIWVGNEMYPGLAMSRSIGDTIAHSVGCSAEPEIITHKLDFKKDKFIILASDGVWEFISSEEAVAIVSAEPTAQQAATKLCQESIKRWRREEEICDDITAVVVFFSFS